MIENIRTEKFPTCERLNFDILCDVCGDDACVCGENGKTFCCKHKKKDARVFVENNKVPPFELPKNYEDGIIVGERNLIEKIKTMKSGTKDLPEARLFSKALSKFLSEIKDEN